VLNVPNGTQNRLNGVGASENPETSKCHWSVGGGSARVWFSPGLGRSPVSGGISSPTAFTSKGSPWLGVGRNRQT